MCEYCTKFHEKPFSNEDGDSEFMLCWNYSSFRDRKKVWHIVALAEGVGVHSGKINYCPMCGRKLNKTTASDGKFYVPDWAEKAFNDGVIYFKDQGEMYIKTLEGDHHASVGDYVIKGVNGELYPCKPDIFEKTYDIVEDDSLEPCKSA